MATYYVRSTDGSNADDGSTWALAKADLHATAWAAGDKIYVSDAHAQSTATAITIATAGTVASPTQIICGDDAAEPPTSESTSGAVTTTGANAITISGACFVSGLIFNCATGGTGANINQGGAGIRQHYKDCSFRLVGSGGANRIGVSAADESFTVWENCSVRFAAAGQGITTGNVAATFVWRGGSLLSGGTAPTTLFFPASGTVKGGFAEISGVDLSNAGTGLNLVSNSIAGSWKVLFRNCKLPSGWNGGLFSGAVTDNTIRAEMHNCDAGDTNYRFWIEDQFGTIKQSTSVYRDGGATDGTTSISWVMATTANAEYPLCVLESQELPAIWNSATGSSKTATVHIVHDGASALNDDEIWLEVQYLGTSGFPVSSFVSDRRGLLASATAQGSSSETWTGDSGTGPNGSSTWNQLKLECTFTPQEAGYIQARVCMAKASTTAYIDPKIVVS